MKRIDAILECYGEDAVESDKSAELDGIIYHAWYIYGIKKEQLFDWLTEEQIIDFYQSGI